MRLLCRAETRAYFRQSQQADKGIVSATSLLLLAAFSVSQQADRRVVGATPRALADFDIGVILIHHTAKTSFKNIDRYKLWDWMYSGAGCAGITNWARALLAIKPETENMEVFKFIAA
jgi:hypothetical protein